MGRLPEMSFCLFTRVSVMCALGVASASAQSLTWHINNTTNIGGLAVTKNGDPQVVETLYGDAVLFDGVDDGLTLGANPIAGATNFTVEMIFRPDEITHAAAWQPRIFHIQSPNPPDHRLTLEARITNGTWYADVFLRTSASANLTLIDSTKVHSLGEWHHLAATYDGQMLRSYVDGRLELSGALAASPMIDGVASIGMRANKVNFFEGAVLALRFTPRVLETNEFMNVPMVVLAPPLVQGGDVLLAFSVTSGLPAEFKLLHSTNLSGAWGTNGSDVLTTNAPGTSYRFTTPFGDKEAFFRIESR